MIRAASLLFFVSLIGGIGCGSAPDEELGATSSAILDGEADQKAGVVGVVDRALGNACSGVLVNDRTVLTARHCVAPLGPDPTVVDCAKTTFGATTDATKVFVRTRGGERAVERVLVPNEAGYCGNDIAVLTLAEAVNDAPIALRVEQRVRAGEKFSAIGLGAGSQLRKDGLSVQCVGSECESAQLNGLEWWGDGAVCDGDSGGPALDDTGRVVGIASRKRAGCTATIYEDVTESAFVASALGIEKKSEAEPATANAGCNASARSGGSAAALLAIAALLKILRR